LRKQSILYVLLQPKSYLIPLTEGFPLGFQTVSCGLLKKGQLTDWTLLMREKPRWRRRRKSLR